MGDGINICHSYIHAEDRFDFTLNIATPEGYEPKAEIVDSVSAPINLFYDVKSAVKNSDLVVTDVWASMGQEEEQKKREKAFADFQVNHNIMSLANDDALFMHCLPAHRGEEVSAALMDDANSVVWDEAENRLHAQKALLEFLFVNLEKHPTVN